MYQSLSDIVQEVELPIASHLARLFEQPVINELSTSTDVNIDITFNLEIFNFLSSTNTELKHKGLGCLIPTLCMLQHK